MGIAAAWALLLAPATWAPEHPEWNVAPFGFVPYLSASIFTALAVRVFVPRLRDPFPGTDPRRQGWYDGVAAIIVLIQVYAWHAAARPFAGEISVLSLLPGLAALVLARLGTQAIARWGYGSGWAVLAAAGLLSPLVASGLQLPPIALALVGLVLYGLLWRLTQEPVAAPAMPTLPLGLATFAVPAWIGLVVRYAVPDVVIPGLAIGASALVAPVVAAALHPWDRVRAASAEASPRAWNVGVLRAGAASAVVAAGMDFGLTDTQVVTGVLILGAVAIDLSREVRFRGAGRCVVAATVERGYEVAAVSEALADADIPNLPANAVFRTLTPFTWMIAPVEILVAEADEARAQQIVRGLRFVGPAPAPAATTEQAPRLGNPW